MNKIQAPAITTTAFFHRTFWAALLFAGSIASASVSTTTTVNFTGNVPGLGATITGNFTFDTAGVLPLGWTTGEGTTNAGFISFNLSNGWSLAPTLTNFTYQEDWSGTGFSLLTTRGSPFVIGGSLLAYSDSPTALTVGPGDFSGFSLIFPIGNAFNSLLGGDPLMLTGGGTDNGQVNLNSGGYSIFNVVTSSVPEPSTYAAFAGAGMLAFACWRRRRAKWNKDAVLVQQAA